MGFVAESEGQAPNSNLKSENRCLSLDLEGPNISRAHVYEEWTWFEVFATIGK
jgi:hypothetical protein